MNTRVCLMVMCFSVIMSGHLTVAMGGFEMELLMTKLDFLQDKLQEIEQTMQTTMEKLEHQQNKIEQMDSKFETKVHAMEESIKKSVKTSEDNTRAKLENISTQIISKMDNILQQQVAEMKTIQETSAAELKKIGENKNSLDMLSDSVRNMSTLSEKSNEILEVHISKPVRSCRQVRKLSGRYVIHVGLCLQPFEVLCEQTTFDGGWTVIQHRFDGSVDFHRGWKEYRNGFGTLDGEFWLGLEIVHQMTKNRPHELLVEVKDVLGNYGYAKYDEFEIGNESEKYKLMNLGTYSGTAGDGMGWIESEKFSTFDRNNDIVKRYCDTRQHGGWWYRNCYTANLNGRYGGDVANAFSWYNIRSTKTNFDRVYYSRVMIRDRIN